MKLDDATYEFEKLFVHPRSDKGTTVPLAILTKLVVAMAVKSLHTDRLAPEIRKLMELAHIPSGDRALYDYIEHNLIELSKWLCGCAGINLEDSRAQEQR